LGAQVSLHLLNARKLVGQFLNRADSGLLVHGDVGFADVGERAFQMSANTGIHAVLMQPGAQIHFGGLQLSEQCPSPQFNNIKAASIHGLSSASGCLNKRD
jgi:hypothetical protein